MVSVTNLGTLNGLTPSNVAAINNEGQIVADINEPTIPQYIALLYQNGALSALTPLSGNTQDEVLGINDSGTMVGYSSPTSSAVTVPSTATVWQNGVATQIALQNGYSAGTATGINDTGQVIVNALSSSHTTTAFLWQNGSLTNLGALGTGFTSAAAINDQGQIVGTSVSGTRQHAFLWQNGKISDLGLAGASTDYAAASAINESGIAVGYETAAGVIDLAVVWAGGKATYLPGLSSSGSSANAINDSGVIVGQAKGDDFQQHAVAWYDGTVIDLQSLVSGPWQLLDATAINNQNQIVGTGLYNGMPAPFEIALPTSATTLTAAEAISDSQAFSSLIINSMSILDSGANIASNLSSLETLAAAGRIGTITFSDHNTVVLSLTPAQLTSDAKALALMSGSFYIAESAAAANASFTGLSGHGNVAVFGDDASDYQITASSNGQSVVVTDSGTGRSSVDTLTNITALQFKDFTDFVAQTPGQANEVTSGNIVELYSAVFAREPDVSGLAFYQAFLATNPTTPLTQLAEYFLLSPEYVNNTAHSYAQSATGDEKFITDSYNNLLHRTPSADEITFYESKVIAPALAGLTPGTTAYANADLAAHALTLVYFSASPEFLSDVQVTAQTPSSAAHWLVLI